MDVLRKNVTLALPVILVCLKQKQEEQASVILILVKCGLKFILRTTTNHMISQSMVFKGLGQEGNFFGLICQYLDIF